MPTIPNITTSIENQKVLILDEHAKNGTFMRNRGRLVFYSGGFSVVYPYKTADGKKWAFRCWHSDICNSKKRYEIIAKAISRSHLDFLCDFDYIDKGVNVEGTIYPTTRMRWVEGITIKDYIWQNKDSKGLLKSLADNFVKMTQALHEQNLAHGDLQHGNILVDNNHQLHLVDYDSFYCPELKGEPDIVTGLPDYQHPSRQKNKTVSEKLDYFSELIIYLSILAIAEKPSLAEKYKVNDADRLLFSKDDYKDIRNSQIYKDIQSLGGDFIELLKILEGYLTLNEIDELEPFELVLQENRIQFTTTVTKAVRNTQEIELAWDVPFKAETFLCNGIGEPQKCPRSGSLKTTLADTTTFELIVETKNGQTITKQLTVEAFDECEIQFNADKYYIFPRIPVTLTWEVKHAKKVWLNGKQVGSSGQKVVEPSKATTYVLSAEDEFGKKEEKISIKMLPIPQIQSLLVPAPNIGSNLGITIKQPKFSVETKFPTIDMGFVKAETPRAPSLTDLGINVELKKTKRPFSLRDTIKKIYHYITE